MGFVMGSGGVNRNVPARYLNDHSRIMADDCAHTIRRIYIACNEEIRMSVFLLFQKRPLHMVSYIYVVTHRKER